MVRSIYFNLQKPPSDEGSVRLECHIQLNNSSAPTLWVDGRRTREMHFSQFANRSLSFCILLCCPPSNQTTCLNFRQLNTAIRSELGVILWLKIWKEILYHLTICKKNSIFLKCWPFFIWTASGRGNRSQIWLVLSQITDGLSPLHLWSSEIKLQS